MSLYEWARRWAIAPQALLELRASMLALDPQPTAGGPARSEAAIQNLMRAEASRRGMRLWRNNVGVYHDPDAGVFVRFGLANDSKELNAKIKSADLIGIRPVVIQQQHVGHTIGQFVSREVKAEDWRWSGTPREEAQARWATFVNAMGGDAKITNRADDL